MKKILIVSSACALGLCAVGLAVGGRFAAKEAKAEINPDHLKTLLTSYNDEGYTKKTQFFLSEEALAEASLFHNGANVPSRATYYNAEETALLMGNYDGTFNGVEEKTGINSGYRNIEGGVQHFVYNAATASEETLFTARADGWTVANQSVGPYYPTLSSLANIIAGNEWNWDDTYSAYYHSINAEGLTIVDGSYSDNVLQQFQYFAAPMLLPNNHYFTWSSVRVTQAPSYLSIRLYATLSDSGKSTLVGDGEALISEARVFKGIHLDTVSQTKKAYVASNLNDWNEADPNYLMEECLDIYEVEQYEIKFSAVAAYDKFKVVFDGAWLGGDRLSKMEFWTGKDDGEDPNIQLKFAGDYVIYYKARPNVSNSMTYVGVDSASSSYKVVYFTNGPGWSKVRFHGWEGENADFEMMWAFNNEYSQGIYGAIVSTVIQKALFYTNDWAGQTVDINDFGSKASGTRWYTTGQDGSGHYTVGTV